MEPVLICPTRPKYVFSLTPHRRLISAHTVLDSKGRSKKLPLNKPTYSHVHPSQIMEITQLEDVELAKNRLRLMQICTAVVYSNYKSQLETLRHDREAHLKSNEIRIGLLRNQAARARNQLLELQRKNTKMQSQLNQKERINLQLVRSNQTMKLKMDKLEEDKKHLQLDLSDLTARHIFIHKQMESFSEENKQLTTNIATMTIKYEEDMGKQRTINQAVNKYATEQSEVFKQKMEQHNRCTIEQDAKIRDLECTVKTLRQELENNRERAGQETISTRKALEKIRKELQEREKTQPVETYPEDQLQETKDRNCLEEENAKLNELLGQVRQENMTLKTENATLLSNRDLERTKHACNKLNELQDKLTEKLDARRRIFDSIQDLRGNIRVFCRIRPPKTTQPRSRLLSIPTSTTGNNSSVVCKEECYSFDRVFEGESSNEDVYKETAGVVEMVLSGSNVCIIAYGQTASGKTHTMDGSTSDPGVNTRALQQLFNNLENNQDSADVHISALEIYNDELQDLLWQTTRLEPRSGLQNRQQHQQKLQIRTVSSKADRVYVPALTRIKVSSVQQVLSIMEKAKTRRSTSHTSMNHASSRSHSIIQVEVEQGSTTSVLQMVDLAGSERVDRSKVTGKELVEAKHINKSLAALGNVLSALETKRGHIPYRDTKLTHFLKNSVGSNAKTLIFVTISDDIKDKLETTATLQFGKRVGKVIINEAHSQQKLEKLHSLEQQLRNTEYEIVDIRRRAEL